MFTLIADLLFPPACLQCKKMGRYLCQKCQYQLRYYTQPLDIDLENPSLDQLYACCAHTDGARQLVKAFKYRCAYALTQTLTQLMVEHIPFPDEIDLFTYIPLHKNRQRQRGFNQAQLLTEQLSHWLHIPYDDLLERNRYTSPQAELDRAQRLTHLAGAFQLKTGRSIVGAHIAVIDDVATTGTTLNEVATVLKQHGAQKVYGVVFAHGR